MKNFLLVAAILLGIFIPAGASFSFLIKYLLMGMLFFTFLKMSIKKWRLTKSHFFIPLFTFSLSLILFLLLRTINLVLAQVVFLSIAAPTAIAAPSIINLLKGNIDYTFISVLITNFASAIFFPVTLSLLIIADISISVVDILMPVLTVMLIPFAAAGLLRFISGRSNGKIKLPKDLTFYLLVVNIYFGVAKASDFVRNEVDMNDNIIFVIAIAIAVITILNFSVGYFFGEKELKIESSQSLGQKNNAFLIWIALTFINPLVAVGPVCYIVYQNFYISYQLYRKDKQKVIASSFP